MTDKLQVQRTALGRYKSYPSYKDSGVEWLGEIPAYWQFMPLKHLCKRSGLYGANEPAEAYIEEGVRFLRTTDISDKGGLVRDGVYLSFETVSDYILQTGDLLFSRSGTIGRSFLYDQVRHGLCAYAGYLVRFVPGPEFFPLFGFYFTKSLQFEHWATTSVISSTIGNVNAQKYANMPCPKPPLAEQKAISAFLDRETAKIDSLIDKNERLIELLQEKRKALITQAVTKGLNPNVPTKDSGVEWLGKIPAHWEVKQLRHVGIAIIGLTYEPADVVGPDEGVLVLRASNIYDGHIVLEDNVFVKRSIPNRLNTKVGDILICARSGSRALIGKSAMIDKALVGLTFGTFMMVFRSTCNDYLFYAFNSTLFSYQSGAFLTSTINQLTLSNLNSFTVPVPPHDERAAIAAFLDRETAKIDSLVAKIHEAIDRLKEYRNTLISAAVTGRIDVREAQ